MCELLTRELLPVEDVTSRRNFPQEEGVIVSEKVISERVISDRPLYDVEADERAIDRPAKCEECPTQAVPPPKRPRLPPMATLRQNSRARYRSGNADRKSEATPAPEPKPAP